MSAVARVPLFSVSKEAVLAEPETVKLYVSDESLSLTLTTAYKILLGSEITLNSISEAAERLVSNELPS